LKAKIFHHLQRTDEAIDVLEQLFNDHFPDSETAGSLALLNFENHNAEKAEFYANKALALDPANYQNLLVRILLKSLKNEATVTEIETLLAINDNDCRLWFILGTTQLHAMNLTAAQEAFAKAAQIEPDFYDNWVSSGWCALLQNHLESAEKSYQRAVTLADDLADGWGGLALVHALKSEPSEAQKCLEKAQWLDSECFLATVAGVILVSHSNPDWATTDINTQLGQALAAIEMEKKTLH